MRRIAIAIVLLMGCAMGRNDDAAGDDPPPSDDPTEPPGEPDPTDPDPGNPPAVRTLEIYSGDGMMVMQGWPSGDMLKVIVLVDGVPVPGVTVTWDVLTGGMAMTGNFITGQHGTSETDAKGIARVGLRGSFESQITSSVPSRIRASIAEGSVEFRTHSTYFMLQAPTLPASYITAPLGLDFGTYAPGAIVPGGLVAQVVYQAGSDQGRGMPDVGMRFVISNTDVTLDDPPRLGCANATIGTRAGGMVFTDAAGVARCDVRVPTAPGQYSVAVLVGGATIHSPYFVTVQ